MNRPAGPEPVPFTSRMTRREIAAVLAYLPLHIGLLPLLLLSLPQTAGASSHSMPIRRNSGLSSMASAAT